jgi:hypothetical protein
VIVPISHLQRICALLLGLALAGIGPRVAAAAGSNPARAASARRTTVHETSPIGVAEVDPGEGSTILSCPGEVRAGQIVELRWSTPAADVEELEILLSLDGGRHYDVRISPEVDPRAKVWRWRVPNLPTSEARLRLRLGSERGEREGAPTPAFTIVGASDRPIERRQVHEGRWWDGPDAFERVSPISSLGASGESIQSSATECAAALPPRAPDVAQEWTASEAAPITTVTDIATSAPDVRRAPRFVPLRN